MAPSCWSCCTASGLTSYATTSWPSRISRRERLAPILPRPTIPSCIGLLGGHASSPSSLADRPGRRGEHDPSEHVRSTASAKPSSWLLVVIRRAARCTSRLAFPIAMLNPACANIRTSFGMSPIVAIASASGCRSRRRQEPHDRTLVRVRVRDVEVVGLRSGCGHVVAEPRMRGRGRTLPPRRGRRSRPRASPHRRSGHRSLGTCSGSNRTVRASRTTWGPRGSWTNQSACR